MSDRRQIGALTATFLVVASMVGTGVFTTSGLLLAELRSAPAVLLAWLFGGLLAMAGALSYAELGAAMPENGGEYYLLSRIYHPSIGFASGVVSFSVGFSAPIAASALAFGSYVNALWPAIPPVPAAVVLVLLACTAHAFRLGVGEHVQNAMTGFKILLVASFVVIGAASITEPARSVAGDQLWLAATLSPGFAIALVYVTFSYSGWNAATYIAGETKNPSTTLPIALVGGTLLVTLLYLAVNLVFLAAAPASELSGVVEVGHVAAVHLLGARAGAVLSGVIAFGLVSTVGALVMTGTRVIEAMGRDHPPLAFFARRSKGGSPVLAVWAQGLLAILLVVSATFDELLVYIGFTLSFFSALTVLGVIVLRQRSPDLVRPYRTWGYPWTPLAFVCLMVWMIVRACIEQPLVALAGVGTIVLGIVLWALTRKR